jgi:hypothetical protein
MFVQAWSMQINEMISCGIFYACAAIKAEIRGDIIVGAV